jgi:hypothetical protein
MVNIVKNGFYIYISEVFYDIQLFIFQELSARKTFKKF